LPIALPRARTSTGSSSSLPQLRPSSAPRTLRNCSSATIDSRSFPSETQRYLDWAKTEDYKLRYIGSLVADFHRNLIAGGIFLYPRDTKNPTKSGGKLRLLYEAAPLAFIAEQAGGRAITDDGREIMDIVPEDLHQRVPLIIGSRQDVDIAEGFFASCY